MQPCPAFTGQLVPLFQRTVGQFVSRFWPFTAHLIKTPSLAMGFVSPFFDKTAGVIVSAALTLVMDDIAVCE